MVVNLVERQFLTTGDWTIKVNFAHLVILQMLDIVFMSESFISTTMVNFRASILEDLNHIGHLDLGHLPHVLGPNGPATIGILAKLVLLGINWITVFANYYIAFWADFSIMPILHNTLANLALNLLDKLPHLVFVNIVMIKNILRIDEYPFAFLQLFLFCYLAEQVLVRLCVLERLEYGILPDTIFGLQSISPHD